MAFPSILTVLDDANRANTGPPPSANWSTPTGIGGISVNSNQFAGALSGNMAIWNPTTFGPDCEARLKITTLPGNSAGMAVLLRGQQTSALATLDGYTVAYTQAAGTDTINAQRVDNSVSTTLGATISQEVAANDSIGGQMIGSTLEVFYQSGAGAWSSLATRSDSTYTGAGGIGMIMLGTTGRADDFAGGTYVAPSGLVIPVAMAQYRQRWG